MEVLGRIDDVLNANMTPDRIRAKRFSAKEYSFGLGALGPDIESVMPYLGEMATMGGTMVWLPTDGNDTPDFLVPRHDSDEVVIQTGLQCFDQRAVQRICGVRGANEQGRARR